jgi:hypothetical protein
MHLHKWTKWEEAVYEVYIHGQCREITFQQKWCRKCNRVVTRRV